MKVRGLGVWFVLSHREPHRDVHWRLDGRTYPLRSQSTQSNPHLRRPTADLFQAIPRVPFS